MLYPAHVYQPKSGGSSIMLPGHYNGIEVVVDSPDAKYIASCGNDGRIKIHDLKGDLISAYDHEANHLVFASCGWLVVVKNEELIVIDVNKENPDFNISIKGTEGINVRQIVRSFFVNRLSTYGQSPNHIAVWNLETAEKLLEIDFEDHVYCVTPLTDQIDSQIILCGTENEIYECNVTGSEATQEVIPDMTDYTCVPVALNWGHGRCVAFGREKAVIVYDVTTKKVVREFTCNEEVDEIQCLGDSLIACMDGSGSVYLWDIDMGELIKKIDEVKEVL
ncbi:hypothetical protein AKO1_006555 [Acrasis kona]